MLKVDKNGIIHLTRGDTAHFIVEIAHNDGVYEPERGDELTFSVKKSTRAEDFIIQKKFKPAEVLVLNPEDTKNVGFGRYIYDVQLSKHNGEIYTIVEPTYFYIKEEITNG